MHDPMTVAFDIRYPWRKYPKGHKHWPDGYRETFITVWHVDPERDGSDDSCDWSGRRRKLNQRERALNEALGDLFHRLGKSPYYPDPFLWGDAPHGEDSAGWGVVVRAQGAMYLWRRRGRLRWHPRYHFWHWKIQIHPLQLLRRWLFVRCAECGKRFGWSESPVGYSWYGGGPVVHSDCAHAYEDKPRRRPDY